MGGFLSSGLPTHSVFKLRFPEFIILILLRRFKFLKKVAKPDGCEWEIDGVCEREIVKKQATANFKVESVAKTGKFLDLKHALIL